MAHTWADGPIVIYSGVFFGEIQNEADLAALIAHEIAHVVVQHVAERIYLSSMIKNSTIGSAVVSPLWTFGQAIAYDLGLLRNRKHYITSLQSWISRRDEYEADFLGILWASRARYDPVAYLEYMKRHAEDDRKVYSKKMESLGFSIERDDLEQHPDVSLPTKVIYPTDSGY
jgi:predicted Zn-dependent protease